MSAMAGSVEELLDLLYTEIEEAKNAPLNNDRCVIERDRVLDMIDDVKAELPVEIKRAKDLVANRNDYIASAKREADSLRQQAEDYAKRLVNEDAIVREAEKKADEILSDAEEQCRMLKAAASEYCEDTLRRMEEAVADDPRTDIRIFGKPVARVNRRMGVVVGYEPLGSDLDALRDRVKAAAAKVKVTE